MPSEVAAARAFATASSTAAATEAKLVADAEARGSRQARMWQRERSQLAMRLSESLAAVSHVS